MSYSTSTLSSVSFLNIFGILVSVVLCVLFLILGGHTLKYIKEFACKIKIIVNRAEDKNIQLKDFNYNARESIQNNPSYSKWETIFKNEIKRSRSLSCCNILGSYIQKYDFILYYPFRNRVADKFDLLKPKPSFYVLLVVLSCCIVWMVTIFFSALLQNLYADINSIPLLIFILATAAIAFISSIFNIICINRLMRIYVLNVKGAFKIDYGNNFVQLEKGFKEYEPENSKEEEEFLKANVLLNADESMKYQSVGPSQHTQRQQDDHLNSTRKLLGEEFERSDFRNSLRQNNFPSLEEVKEEDRDDIDANEGGPMGQSQNQFANSVYSAGGTSSQRKGRTIKDVFNLQLPIDGVEEADEEEKYIFVEDKHAIGDVDLLNNEAMKGENKSNLSTFVTLFLVISCGSAICCYLNYQFPTLLAQYVFYMYAGAFFGDLIVTRVLILMIMSLFKLCGGAARGYRKIPYKSQKEIKDLLGSAIKSMFDQRKQLKIMRSSTFKKHSDSQSNLSHSKGDDFNTQHDRHETSFKNNFKMDSENEQQISNVDDKRDEDGDGEKSPELVIKDKLGSLGDTLLKPDLELDQKNHFEKTQQVTQAYQTNTPLLSNLTKAIRQKEDEAFHDLMEKKQLVNELVDYNLLLLRKIYDAYDGRADKVLNNFRTDKHSVIRKRYMVPIINPNYDYERLLQEMREKSNKAQEDHDEESVHLDGETVCEDQDEQLMEAITEESHDLVQKKIGRQQIDKFGNTIDEETKRNGVQKATPQPHFDQIEMEAEDEIVEDDELAKRKVQYDDLKRRLANSEQLTEEELALLYQLEQERIDDIDSRLKYLLSKGFENLTDEEKLEFYDLNIEKLNIEKSRLLRKTSLTVGEQQRLDQINQELKRFDYDRLKVLKQMGLISEEELLRLNQKEEEFMNDQQQSLLEKLRNGTLTEEELQRLLILMKQKGLTLSEEDQQKLKLTMKNFNMLSQEELDKDLFDELMQKFRDGTITAEELQKLMILMQKFDVQLTNDEMKKVRDYRKQFGMLTQGEMDQDLMQELMRKLREGTITEEELKKLMELMDQNGEQMSEEDLKIMRDARKKYGLLNLEELEMDELEELKRKLMSGEITEEELKRLMELSNKYGVQFSGDEIQMIREAEDRLCEVDHSRHTENEENFQELPPVVVMNKVDNSPLDQNDSEKEQVQEQDQEQLQEQEQELLQEQEQEQVQEQDQEQLQEQEQEQVQEQEQELLQEQEQVQEQEQEQLQEQEADPTKALGEQDQSFNMLVQDHPQEDQSQSNIFDSNVKNLQEEKDSQFNDLDDMYFEEEQAIGEQNQINDLQQQQQQINLQQEAEKELEDQTPNGSIHSQRATSRETLRQVEQNLTVLPLDSNRQKFGDIEFGREDLEDQNLEESIYSHKTTTILDEEKVSFMHIEHLPNQDQGSEDSFDEQDMVYYNKDDITNYSKHLNLNKVKAKNASDQKRYPLSTNPQNYKYYSENDLNEIQESEASSYDGADRSRLSGRAKSRQIQNQRARSTVSWESSPNGRQQTGRGQIHHNQLSPEDHSDLIDGHVKVDSWNLNYRGKKKQHRKKKVSKDQKSKIASLQDIYGIDAKTLAGISKGRLPRKLLASGKLKGDGTRGGDFADPNYNTELSFRSTQNTFGNKMSTAGKSKMKQSTNDNMSNMFSFNGYGTSNRWNEIKSTLKGGPGAANLRESNMGIISEFDGNNGNSRFQSNNKNNNKSKLPNNLIATYQDFNSVQQPNYGAGQNGFMEEEFKSEYSGSQGDPRFQSQLNSGYGASKQKGGYNNSKNNKATSKNPHARRSQSSGMDSHSESDEAVDDNGAIFQKRNLPFGGKSPVNVNGVQSNFGGINDDLDHSESEEGLNNENPSFDGNEFAFKKRINQDANAQGNGNKLSKTAYDNAKYGTRTVIRNNFAARGRGAGRGSNGRGSSVYGSGGRGSIGSRSSGILEIEDLEAQLISGKRGKKSSNKKPNQQLEDSDDENLGGDVRFQKAGHTGYEDFNLLNKRPNYNTQDFPQRREASSTGMNEFSKGSKNQNSQKLLGQNKNKNNNLVKGGKQNKMGKVARDSDGGEEVISELNNLYGERYNVSGNVHPGGIATSKNRDVARITGYSDGTDNSRAFKGSRYNQLTETENNGPFQGKRKIQSKAGGAGRNANSRVSGTRGISQNRGQGASRKTKINGQKLKANRSLSNIQVERADQSDGSGEEDFIVGPESNLSMIKQRNFNQGNNFAEEDEDDEFLLLQKERLIKEELESSKMEGSRLAKKRKIRKAAQSQNPRDEQQRKIQEMQNKRLQKMKLQAERALVDGASEGVLEMGQMKKLKKKTKKDFVKKEINYWLDYDSPYSEYLVARFREWSPNPKNIRAGSSNSKRNQPSSKFNDMKNVYTNGITHSDIGSRQGSSKQNSKSPNRAVKVVPADRSGQNYLMANVTQQNRKLTQQSQSQQQQFAQVFSPNDQIFLDDFEEP